MDSKKLARQLAITPPSFGLLSRALAAHEAASDFETGERLSNGETRSRLVNHFCRALVRDFGYPFALANSNIDTEKDEGGWEATFVDGGAEFVMRWDNHQAEPGRVMFAFGEGCDLVGVEDLADVWAAALDQGYLNLRRSHLG